MLGDSLLQRRPHRPQAVTGGREEVRDFQTSFVGGLNITSVDDELRPDQYRRSENCRQLPVGAVAKRGGSQRTADALVANEPVRSGTTWYQSDGTRIILATCDGRLFRTTYAATFPLTWVELIDPARSTGLPRAFLTGSTPSYAAFVDAAGDEAMFIADGLELSMYDGTDFTEHIPGTEPVAQIAVHNERLWGVGVTNKPQSLFYSALNNGETLGDAANGGGEIIVRTFGNQRLVGLASLATSLLLFHSRGVSRLTGFGQDDISVQPSGISEDVGTFAPFSVVVINNVAYFVSDRGLYVATEQEVIAVATPEQPDPLAKILPALSEAEIAEIRCCLNRATRELLVWVPNYGIYVFHTILKAWCGPWTDGYMDPAVRCLFEAANFAGYPIVFAGDDSGFVVETDRPDVGVDNMAADGTGGTAIVMALQARRFYCELHHAAKAWRWAYVLASMGGSDAASLGFQTGTASGSKPFDPSSASTWGDASTTWGDPTTVWGGAGQLSHEFELDGNGYAVDLTIADSSTAKPVISQMGVVGFVLGRR